MEANQLIARRAGRIAFGGVLVAGAVYLVAAAHITNPDPLEGTTAFHAAHIIAATWLLAAVTGSIARRVAARARPTGVPDQLLVESWVAPAIGIALLLPLTLHMPVVLASGNSAAFDAWVLFSTLITGPAHLVFATTSAMRAYQLASGKPAWSPRSILVGTLVTSCVPFVLLYAIPPVLVAITGLPIVLLLRAMERWIGLERKELTRRGHPLPQAIVRGRPAA